MGLARNFWVRAGISAALVFALVAGPLDFQRISAAFSDVDSTALALAFAAWLLLCGLSIARWSLLLRAAGYLRSLGEIARATVLGQALNLILPAGVAGDFVKAALVSEPPDRRYSPTLGTIVADRLLGLAALVAVGACVLAWPSADAHLPPALRSLASAWWLAAPALGLMIALAVIWLDNRVPHSHGRLRQYLAALSALSQAVFAYRSRPLTLITVFFLCALSHLVVCLPIWWIGQSLGAPSLSIVILTVSFAFIVTLLPVGIGGLGTRELAFIVVLAAEGIPPESATVLSLTWFAVSAIGTIGIAVPTAFLTPALDSLGGPIAGFSRFGSNAVRKS